MNLPAAFADLEPIARDWALPSFNERLQRRASGSMPELRAAYDALQPRAEAMIQHLEGFSLDDLPPAETHLMRLLFALAQLSMAIEVHGAPKIAHASLPIAVRVLRESAPV